MPVDDVLPGYDWDKGSNRYRSRSTGRYVARSNVLNLLDAHVNGRETQLASRLLSLAEGKLAPSVWLEGMKLDLKRLHLQNAALGAGGWDRLNATDYGRIGGVLQADYRRLKVFAGQIASGEISEAQALNRLHMYLGQARSQFYAAERARLAPSAPGRVLLERRVLGAAEHCFLAGAMVATPEGELPIEALRVGDLVLTRNGARRVTRLYRRLSSGPLVKIEAGKRWVWCTLNHPFLTERGWVNAGDLRSRDNVMLLQKGFYPVVAHVGFPDTNDSVTASSQASVSGAVPSLLDDLSLSQRSETGMTMPPVAVCFNDERSNSGVDNESGFNEAVRFKADAQIVQDAKHSRLQLRWPFALSPLLGQEEMSKLFGVKAKTLFPRLAHAFRGAWLLGRVTSAHVLGCSTMYLVPIAVGVHSHADLVSSVDNMLAGQVEHLGASVRPSAGVVIPQALVHFFAPAKTVIVRCAAFLLAITLRSTNGAGVPGQARARKGSLSTSETGWHLAISSLATLRANLLAALNAAPAQNRATVEAASQDLLGFGDERRRANRTDFMVAHVPLPLDSVIPTLYHDTRTLVKREQRPSSQCSVYNLEVEDDHEYVVAGMVVHNCSDCVSYYDQGWQPAGSLPLIGDSQCDGNCRCTVERREVNTGEEGEWIGSKR